MKNMYDYILSNLAFITRIPVHFKFEYKSDQGNVKYFPLIGILLGILMLVITIIAQKLFGNLVAAVVSVFFMVMLTGGIHLDGLTDTADGLLSYKDQETIIEIMKDSRIGAMGVIVLVGLLLLKFAFINRMLEGNMLMLLLLYPVFGRIAIVNACYLGQPITKSKLGAGYIGNIGKVEYVSIQLIYTLTAVVFAYLFFMRKYQIILPILVTVIFLFVFSKHFVKKVQIQLGGISGDILGAICEIGELLSLPVLYLGVEICKKLI